jgi:phi13 family phage major tail protein
MSKGVAVGLTNLVYAIMTADVPPTTVGGTDGYAAYDSATRILGAITANFAPNASNDTLFADDGPYESASTLGAMTLELNIADLPAAQRAELLGATYDEATGILTHTGADKPPYVAVGMSIKKSNGFDRYIWYLKGRFVAPDDNNQTKADSINWNTPTITGNFLKRDCDQQWRVAIDTDDPNVTETVKNTWFDSPNVNTLTKVEAPVANPVSGTLSKGATAKVALTSSTAGATVEYKLSTEEVWHAYNDTDQVATTGWTAGTTVVVNARATKAGMAPATANFTYKVTA